MRPADHPSVLLVRVVGRFVPVVMQVTVVVSVGRGRTMVDTGHVLLARDHTRSAAVRGIAHVAVDMAFTGAPSEAQEVGEGAGDEQDSDDGAHDDAGYGAGAQVVTSTVSFGLSFRGTASAVGCRRRGRVRASTSAGQQSRGGGGCVGRRRNVGSLGGGPSGRTGNSPFAPSPNSALSEFKLPG
ncbi:hypothetical protein PG989_015164 [Apiospora arundinis]